MKRRTAKLRSIALRIIALTLLVLAPAAAYAEYFTVTMTNGTTFQTRYRPVPAEWDDNVVMIATDRGNWIGLYSSEVADVTSHAEITGFGYQLDTTTLFVGWSPNDVYDEDEEGAGTEGGTEDEGLDLEEMFPEAESSGLLEQFVNIGSGVASQSAQN